MKSLLQLWPYFKRYKKMFIRGAVLVVFSSAAQALWPRFFGNGIDAITRGTATPQTLLVQAGIIVVLSFISGFLYYRVRQNIIVASRLIEYDLRNDLLAHVERLSMRFFQNTPQGELMAYATNDIDAVRFFIGPSIMYSLDTLSTFLAVLGFMLVISPTLTLAVVIPLPLMSLAVYFIGKKVHPLFDAVQAHFATMTGRTTESISGIRVVRAYVREAYEKTVFNGLAKGYFDKNMRLARTQGLMQPIIFGFMGFSTVVLLLVGGSLIISKHLTIGQLTQFVVYLGMLTWPFIALGWVTSMVQRGAASMARLTKLFDTKPEIENSQQTNWQIASLRGEIAFHNVSFRYRPELGNVLENISLRIEQGTTLAIMGRTGSGKTSLVNLIARLFDPAEGSVTIDGHDLRTIPLDVLRMNIGFVTQEPFLFSETIAENIAFGTQEVTRIPTDNRILGYNEIPMTSGFPKLTPPSPLGTEEAARAADIYDNVIEFPEQFETMIGERGITLSGGQKQRTAIARALARNPRILVMDDAMSAVDTATEDRILSNLRNDALPRTTILISHRTSTAREADMIIVLDRGRIIERGTHQELLAAEGQYYDLYKRQLLEESLESA
jgi:ATP-binding cassette, subfamily B, multidrug efflux pump